MRNYRQRRYMIDILTEEEIELLKTALDRAKHSLFFPFKRVKIEELIMRLRNAKEVK